MRVTAEKHYYVYTHSINGDVFYVGKGREGRAFTQDCRNSLWKDFVSSLTHYDVDIVKEFKSSAEALLFENNLIAKINPKCNLIRNFVQREANVCGKSPHHEEPDWVKKIARIQSKGMTQEAIEKETGVKQVTVSQLKLGIYKRVSWVVGNAIIKLDEKLRGK